MTYNPQKLGGDDVDGAILMHDFFEDCGGDPQFQLSCFNEETKEAEVVPLIKPFMLVGRSGECDICFKDREVSYRHAYLQLLNERLLVVDLGSRTGTSWKGNRRRSGWLLPGREVQFGPHLIKLVRLNKYEDDYPKEGESNLELRELIAKEQKSSDTRPFPHATLELLSVNSKSPTGKTLVLKPGVTLIGRSRVAQIRLKHDSVSHVHSSLVLTQNGLWLIDLLGRGGSYVNGEQVEYALLQRGDVLSVGAFHLRVETGHMKPLTGAARAQLKNPPPDSTETRRVNGDSTHMQQEDVSTQQIQAIKTDEDSSQSGSIDPSNVLHEDHQDDHPDDSKKEEASGGDSSMIEGDDPSRWGEIIEALKSGGFGT